MVDSNDDESVRFSPIEDAEWWNGPASDFDAGAKLAQRTVEAAFGEKIDDLKDAID